MVITTKAVAFLLLGIGLLLCSWRFFSAFKKKASGDRTAFLLTFFLFVSGIQNLVLGLGVLLFSSNFLGIYIATIFSDILLVLHAMLGIYTAQYIFHPKNSPIFLTGLVGVFGIMVVIMELFAPPEYFFTSLGSIDWHGSTLLSFGIFCLLSISISSFVYIFSRIFQETKNYEVKMLSLLLSILGIGGFVNIFVRFIILGNIPTASRSLIFDAGMGLIGIMFVLFLILMPHVKKNNF